VEDTNGYSSASFNRPPCVPDAIRHFHAYAELKLSEFEIFEERIYDLLAEVRAYEISKQIICQSSARMSSEP